MQRCLLFLLLLSTELSLLRISLYLHTPKFSLLETAHRIESYVIAESNQNNVLMGHFSDTLALAAPSIQAVNDRLGYRSLAYKVEAFDPGYYVSIGTMDDNIKATLQQFYAIELIETFEVYQNRDNGQSVFLYRLSHSV